MSSLSQLPLEPSVDRLTGQCQCKAITFACEGAPRRVEYCHCEGCRRAVSGPFAVLVWYLTEQVRGNLLTSRVRRSSSESARGFCEECGTPLYLQLDGTDEVGILVGAFDEVAVLNPTQQSGVSERLPWVTCGADLPQDSGSGRH